MKDLSWYINRLSKMSASEILYRLQYKIREKRDEHVFSKKPLSIPSGEYLSPSSFFILSQHATIEQFSHWHTSTIFNLLAKADQCLENTVDIFGLIHNFGKQIDWHLDAKTGKRWPQTFWSKVNIRDGFTYGGPKFVWEANRLYGLSVLGLAYRTTKTKKYADKFFQLVSEWLEGNPYPYGVNWTSGIELGVRIANLVWGLSFLQGYKLSKEDQETLNTFVYIHAWHLFRYHSKYSSNNNHAIAEAFGLFLIGVYFPYFRNASQWRTFGQAVLERECLRQILPDGGSYEYSSTYLSFVFDFFLLFKIVCDKQGIPYDRAIDRRLEKSCEYIHCLMDRKGNMPNIGDQDSAILVNFGLSNHENFTSILNTGSLLFNRKEFQQDNFPDIKTFFLLGGEKGAKTRTNTDGASTRDFLKESGLTVIRGRLKGKNIVFVGNASPLGMPPLYAHGHLDALSFYLTIDGREIFVDPGTYLYHCGGKWRRYFRSTAAHNTIRINKSDFTEMPGDFMFGKPYTITKHELIQKAGEVIWTAGHDAYQHLTQPVFINRQAIVNWTDSKIILADSVDTEANCLVEFFFHFHPDCVINPSDNVVAIENKGVALQMFFDEGVSLELFRGDDDLLLGWFSNAFHHLAECWTVVAKIDIKTATTVRTEIQVL